jgi:hypothetical protein
VLVETDLPDAQTLGVAAWRECHRLADVGSVARDGMKGKVVVRHTSLLEGENL